MRLQEFDYELPPECIAQHPSPERDSARLLLLDRSRAEWSDHRFRELPQLLRRGDLLVLNDSRVLPARLFGWREGVHAQPLPGPRNPARHDYLRRRIEVLLTRALDTGVWQALVRPGRKLATGERLWFGAPAPLLRAEIAGRGALGERTLRFSHADGRPFLSQEEFLAALEQIGHVPLPPYLHRTRGEADRAEDRERYQTVFAREPGSAAAPTAGLHFSHDVLARLAEAGVETAKITLEVGLGTFQPVRAEEVEDHPMHAERYRIAPEAAAAVNQARQAGRRIIAVGTTSARALEASARAHDGAVAAGAAETDLFLYPGQRFQVVQALLTNFHAPRSTLLMLVAAFAGLEFTLSAYRHAIASGYRFLSYGDCMLIV